MLTWLIAIRKEQNMSQKSVAELISITQPSYCNIEKGKRNPCTKTAKRIAEVFGFDWTRFYDENGAK